MNENSELKQIDEHQFLTTKDKLGYAEEYIVVKHDNPKNDLLLNYSLSNSLEDIKIAIFNRTGLNINIEKAIWKLNSSLTISVKHLMNKHKTSYSMTTYNVKKDRIIVINMRVCDNWFIAKYEELSITPKKCRVSAESCALRTLKNVHSHRRDSA